MERYTHLGRPLDLRLASNQVAVAVSLAAGVVGFLLSDAGLGRRLLDGVVALAAAFLAWALAREIDPDRPLTATLAVVVGGAAAALLGGASVGALYLLMVAARVLIRTTGLPPSVPDLVVNLVIVAVVARSPSGWIAGMALALAVARDVTLPDPAPRNQLWWSLGYAAAASAVAGIFGELGAWVAPTPAQWAIVAAGLAGGVVLVLRPEAPSSTADLSEGFLLAERLQWARGLVVVALGLATVIGGGLAISSVAAAWITVALAGGMRLVR